MVAALGIGIVGTILVVILVIEFSQDQLALSLLRVEGALLSSAQTPEEAFEIVHNVSAGTAENGRTRRHSPSAKRPSAKSKSGR